METTILCGILAMKCVCIRLCLIKYSQVKTNHNYTEASYNLLLFSIPFIINVKGFGYTYMHLRS